MPLEHLNVNEALLAHPAAWRIRQHMDDCQAELLLQSLQLLTEGDRFPILAAIKQDYGPLVAAVGERADHAYHRCDADAAGDQHVHVRRVADGERAVGSVEIDALAHWHIMNLFGEVA